MADESPPPETPAPSPEAFPRTKRQAWKEKARAGRNRNGNPIPKPATAKEAKQIVKKLAQEAVVAIATDKSITADAAKRYGAMSSVVRAHILSYLGEDIEAARSEFANELMANARKVAHHIMEKFQEYPPSVQAFVFTSFVDKSEALHAKAATNPRTAAVSIQINSFGDGVIDREKLIGQLTGAAFGVAAEPKPVVPVQAVPVPQGTP